MPFKANNRYSERLGVVLNVELKMDFFPEEVLSSSSSSSFVVGQSLDVKIDQLRLFKDGVIIEEKEEREEKEHLERWREIILYPSKLQLTYSAIPTRFLFHLLFLLSYSDEELTFTFSPFSFFSHRQQLIVAEGETIDFAISFSDVKSLLKLQETWMGKLADFNGFMSKRGEGEKEGEKGGEKEKKKEGEIEKKEKEESPSSYNDRICVFFVSIYWDYNH